MKNSNLKNKLLLLIKILFIYFSIFTISSAVGNEKLKNITEGNASAKIKILVYESLTCPHCATFHKEIYPDLKSHLLLA